jgi:hypothetical protein
MSLMVVGDMMHENARQDTLEESISSDHFNAIIDQAAVMQEYLEKFRSSGGVPKCRDYRLATTPYLRYMKAHGKEIAEYVVSLFI